MEPPPPPVPSSSSQPKTSTSSANNPKNLLNQTSQSLPTSVQCSPIFVEYQLMKEFVLFQKQEFLHVYISPSHGSAFEWFAVMFIHHGIYRGKIFRFSILINPSYPNCDYPKILFDPIPYHPLVDQHTGELRLSTKFSNWNSTSNFIFEVIEFTKKAFEFDNLEELKILVNVDTFDIDTESLKKIVDETMKDFNEQVIQTKRDDKNYIDFTEPEDARDKIEKLRQRLLTDKLVASNDSGGIDFPITSHGSGSGTGNPSGRNFCSTSISGLSWAKKIVYN